MKQRAVPAVTMLLLTLAVHAADLADPAEPGYQGKPISYWINGLLFAAPEEAPPLLDSIKACGEIGWPGMPYLLKQPWGYELRVSPETPQRVIEGLHSQKQLR